MSEGGDSWDPGPWRGYDYSSARASYDSTAGRDYSSSSSRRTRREDPDRALDDLVPPKLVTNARSPLGIILDGTGSMGDFVDVIMRKLPLLDLGVKDYLDDPEFMLAVVGDAYCDKYPLHVRPATKGIGLVDAVGKLTSKIEKGGGAGMEESYDLAALYFARNVEMPKAVNPVLIWICDEGVYQKVDPEQAKSWARTDLEGELRAKELFEDLKSKYSVYAIRKHYGNGVRGDQMTGWNLKIHKQWENYLGADRIAILNNPNRVVDVIFALLADHSGKQEAFEKELGERQRPSQVREVMESVCTIGRSYRIDETVRVAR